MLYKYSIPRNGFIPERKKNFLSPGFFVAKNNKNGTSRVIKWKCTKQG